MPAFAGRWCFHVAKCINLAIYGNKKDVSKKDFLLTSEKSTQVRVSEPEDAPNSARRNCYLEPLGYSLSFPAGEGGSQFIKHRLFLAGDGGGQP